MLIVDYNDGWQYRDLFGNIPLRLLIENYDKAKYNC